ncbi:MAG: sugar phosphate nucleotidyltransferase, partial [Planctomycetota bacterium]|nr:sugar phosphate nucleotidyltransferase [Planctomycetota bacterium]
TTYTDFGKEVFPAAIRARKVKMHLFDGYWEDIGTIGSFYKANLGLAEPNPPFEFSSPQGPIYTRARFLHPTRLGNCKVQSSLIADGCDIGDGCVIENSVIGLRTVIADNTIVRNSILMGSDYFNHNREPETLPLGIGYGSIIENAIIDKNCRIGKEVKIIGNPDLPDSDTLQGPCTIRDGIAVISKGSQLPDHWTNSDLT